MAVFAVLQQAGRSLPVHTGKQAVLGNIVAAHGKEFNTVAAQRKRLSPPVRFPGYGHCPQSQAQRGFIFSRTSGICGHLQDVQRLFSQSVRPPEPRIFRFQAKNAVRSPVCRCDCSSFRVRQFQRDFLRFSCHADLQRNQVRFMNLMDPNIFQPGVVAFDEYLPPDAGIRQPGTPVPAEHVVRFSERAGPQQFTSAGIGHIGVFLCGFFHIIQGG